MSFNSVKPGTLLNPTPCVLVSCGNEQTPHNLITIAWTGTVNSTPPMVSISVQPKRYSHDIILSSGEFVVNLMGGNYMNAVDFCGVRSGRDTDKFGETGLTPMKVVSLASAPCVKEAEAFLACRVNRSISLGSHTMFIADVVEIGVQDRLMDPRGKIRFEDAGLFCYCHGSYVPLAKAEGFFGFSVASMEALSRRMPEKTR